MSKTEYGKARKRAQKTYRNQLLKGTYPYLQALDDIVSFAGIASEVDLGLVEIPLDAIAGTKTSGRQNAFASDFMPLLDDGSEFADKWSHLYEAHLEEGIHDPITAVEFMNRFYVIEGNKRVSVLKYVGAVSIPAYVTRYIPRRDGSLENRIYYEFLDFYNVSSVNYLTFSQEGCYARLLSLLGKSLTAPWSDDEKLDFHSAYIHFLDVYEEKGGNRLALTPGDAFLTYLEIYGYTDLLQKSYKELRAEIPAIWKDFQIYPKKRSVELLTAPEEAAEKPLVQKLLPHPAQAPIRIAFIHDRTSETSSWTYGHELGRHYLEDVFAGRITTSSYEDCGSTEKGTEAIRQAVEEGSTILFTTSPKLLNASVKAALKYPSIRILNCSLNSCFGHLRTYYGRMYEAKFLTGLLAGILSPGDAIGYAADYPIYGSMASINAFALGVRMVAPKASVYLEWTSVKDSQIDSHFRDRGISYVSGQDLVTPTKASRQFGLYDIRDGQIVNTAMPVLHWGKFYERIVRSILNGGWKKNSPKDTDKSLNYFWGMSSGLIDVICSKHVPAKTVMLIELVKREICSGAFHPFSGEIRSQDGTLKNAGEGALTEAQIGSMDWLVDNVCGMLPEFADLTETAQKIVRLQGVAKYEEYKGNFQ